VTYAALDALFLGGAALVLVLAIATAPDRARLVRRWGLTAVVAGVALILLTSVFDALMIGAGLMSYSRAMTSGLRIGRVPIEDFAYPVAGLMLLPAVWVLARRRSR
jgi:lycopene cyclase domain-containing protein